MLCPPNDFQSFWPTHINVGTVDQRKQVRWSNYLLKFCDPAPPLSEFLWVQFFMSLLFRLCKFAVFSLNIHSCLKCNPESCWGYNIWCQIFCVSLGYIAQKSLFIFTVPSSLQHQGVLDCTFPKICCLECQKCFLCTKVCLVSVIAVWRIVMSRGETHEFCVIKGRTSACWIVNVYQF